MQNNTVTLSRILVLIGIALFHAGDQARAEERPWCNIFAVSKAELSDVGKNRYFLLWPGYRMLLQHGQDTLTISVLDETKIVDGVKTRVIEERETNEGKLVEVSRNYFAISKLTGDVYFFGEDVDIYQNGKIASHEGSWLAGVNGAKFGLMMPGRPAVGDKYHQESAAGVAMDRAEIISCTEDCTTTEGAFENCVHVRETSAGESGRNRRPVRNRPRRPHCRSYIPSSGPARPGFVVRGHPRVHR